MQNQITQNHLEAPIPIYIQQCIKRPRHEQKTHNNI